MKKVQNPQHSTVTELCGFCVGCLLGGLGGVAAGLWCRTEVAIVTNYALGFVGGGFLGAIITRQFTR